MEGERAAIFNRYAERANRKRAMGSVHPMAFLFGGEV